jgi:hypothetical protein
MKLAIFYDPECPKLTAASYSATYLDMLQAVVGRFADVQHITKGCSAKDIEADVILIYDIHSSHHIEIDGLAEHKAIKYTYFNDPHQQEFKGQYTNGPKVHKLGQMGRTLRSIRRGVDYIICPYKNGYYQHIAPYLSDPENTLFWFPPAPSIKRFPEALRTKPLSERKHKILGNGILHDGGLGAYEFRKWAFAQPQTYFVKHTLERPIVPKGQHYSALLSGFAGALALCDWYVVPKYLEIPLAGCVCFAQDHEEYRNMGFSGGENCIKVEKHNFNRRTQKFLDRSERFFQPDDLQRIADAGRKLIEENWTAECFADALYNHARSKGA